MSEATATISPDGMYRYRLGRRWAETGKHVLFAMLNPSKADALVNDPTATRCIGFAQSWGFASLSIVNPFAWRATDPRELNCGDLDRMIGPENDEHIRGCAAEADLIVAAWGASIPRGGTSRIEAVLRMLREYRDVYHLGLTAKGQPRHPLYLRGDTRPTLWHARRVLVAAAPTPEGEGQ